MKILNKALAFILTVTLTFGGGFVMVDAAENITVGMEDGLVAADMTFSGTSKEVKDEVTSLTLLRDRIGVSNLLEMSVTFKITSAGKEYINLFEIYDSSDNASAATAAQSSIAVIVSKTGRVFFETGANKTGTDWQVDTGVSDLADGRFHTLKLSASANALKCKMDDAAEKETTTDGAKNTKKFMTAFFGGTAAGYQDWRGRINAVAIGGLSADSYFKNDVYENLNGEIRSFSLNGGIAPDDQAGSGFSVGMFSAEADNTWLFGGGIETQGRFAEIGGFRNYIGQFEEWIRWSNSGGTSAAPLPMQRYTINAGKKGQDAVKFAADLDTYIEKTDPKAVSYLIGPEDYEKGNDGIAEFKEALLIIIQKALAMRGGAGGYVVIQLPHAVSDAAAAENISAYAGAAREAYRQAASTEGNAARMALVDHLDASDTKIFKEENLTENLLNAKGHYEIAKQLAQTVKGSVGNFLNVSESFRAEEGPDLYLADMPEAAVVGNDLNVTVPEHVKGTEFSYTITVCGTKISGTAYENPFRIEDLPAGEAYELTVQCKDDNTTARLSAAEGVIVDKNIAKAPEITGDIPKNIRLKAEDQDTPLTWLFMGDSITHGAQHTKGYDGIAQLFEKYLKEDLGRVDDVVVNTAVSGATAEPSAGRGTLTHIEQRMKKYKPDIVSVMLGTNDSIDDAYEANLKSIVDEIRAVNKDAVIIFRSPTPAGRTWAGKLPGENGSVARMKKVADANGVLFIDQYTDWNKELDAYPYLFNSAYYFGDGYLHPGGAGHARMTAQFIRECGLDANTKIADLSYRFDYAGETSELVPVIETSEDRDGITVDKTALQTAFGSGTIGDLTVALTDAEGRVYIREMGLEEDTMAMYLPTNRRYTVNVTANMKGAAAKKVVFGEQEILLGEESADTKDQEAADAAVNKIYAIGDITEVIRPAQKKAIKDAREAYEGLSESQKLLAPNTAMKLLRDAEAALDRQEADAVKNLIAGLDNMEDQEITEEKAEQIRNAAAAFEALTQKQKSLISASMKECLAMAKEALNQKEEADRKEADQEAANAAASKIQAIGTVAYTAESKKKIDEARAAYNALTDAQKQLVSGGVVKLLTDAEAKYRALADQSGNNGKTEIGKTCAKGNCVYRITGGSTAETAGLKADAEKTIKIPDTVELNGKTYRVTSVGDAAFSKKKAVNAVIGRNVEKIGKSAFAGCTKLKKVTIKSAALKEIGSKAFNGCKSLKNITIKSKVLKKAGKNCFKGIHKNAVIKVPSKKCKDYEKRLRKKGQGKSVKIK